MMQFRRLSGTPSTSNLTALLEIVLIRRFRLHSASGIMTLDTFVFFLLYELSPACSFHFFHPFSVLHVIRVLHFVWQVLVNYARSSKEAEEVSKEVNDLIYLSNCIICVLFVIFFLFFFLYFKGFDIVLGYALFHSRLFLVNLLNSAFFLDKYHSMYFVVFSFSLQPSPTASIFVNPLLKTFRNEQIVMEKNVGLTCETMVVF